VFKKPIHEEFGTWALGFVPYGGADVGQVMAVADAVGDGGDDDFYDAWRAAGDKLAEQAADAEANSRSESARECFLRASACYAIAYHPIYGKPVDPRLLDCFRAQIATFEKGLALCDPPVESVSIPYGDTAMPGYLVRATGRPDQHAPLLIGTNGYDASVTEMYFGFAIAAAARGYHCLIFDGPGQGKLLIEEGIPMRADWENVVAPVVDFALGLEVVDPDRVALMGWSLGGYLAPRAASGERRLAACIADPGQDSIMGGMTGLARHLGIAQDKVDSLPDADPETLEKLEAGIASDPRGKWALYQRGYWVNGADDFAGWLKAVAPFSMEGRYELIECPTLVTYGETDPLGAGAPAFHEKLRCEKSLVQFPADQGAGGHCEMLNRPMFNRVAFDWLDETFGRLE
jgi:pimeloyl-ACP methyl ester carboxylesterase